MRTNPIALNVVKVLSTTLDDPFVPETPASDAP